MGSRRDVMAVSAVGALVLALASCTTGSGGGDDAPSGATETSVGPTRATSPDDPATEPDDGADVEPTPEDTQDGVPAPSPFPANTDPDTQDPSADAMLTVTDVSTGHHDGFDRVVFELDGTGAPGWRVEYVDDPVDDGSGKPVDVAGDTFLQVRISGTGYPMDTGVEEYSGPDPVVAADGGAVDEVTLRGVFEGYTTAFIGVDDGPRPFRAFALEDPTRVVVDVRDDD